MEYEDAVTGEPRYGVIAGMPAGSAIITTISKEEAGPKPKRLAKHRVACTLDRDNDGNAICGYHRKPLNHVRALGPGRFSAWVCRETGKQVYKAVPDHEPRRSS